MENENVLSRPVYEKCEKGHIRNLLLAPLCVACEARPISHEKPKVHFQKGDQFYCRETLVELHDIDGIRYCNKCKHRFGR